MRVEPWILSYGLLGLTQSGLIPILMPLVAPGGSAAGLTYAAFSLPGLLAPIVGTWADRTGRHRDLLVWGTLASGLLFLLFDFAGVPLRILLAAGAGLGAMAATTAGNVLAIQGAPEAEWDNRVARLQRFVSAGQVIGLLAAGLLAHSHPGDGFVFAGIVLLAACGCAHASAPGRSPRDPRDKPDAKPMVGGDAGVGGAAHRHGHHVGWQELGAYLKVINQRLRRFLIVWLIAYPAMNGFATLFPVAMTHQFGMDPILPSSSYAIGVWGQPAAVQSGGHCHTSDWRRPDAHRRPWSKAYVAGGTGAIGSGARCLEWLADPDRVRVDPVCLAVAQCRCQLAVV